MAVPVPQDFSLIHFTTSHNYAERGEVDMAVPVLAWRMKAWRCAGVFAFHEDGCSSSLSDELRSIGATT